MKYDSRTIHDVLDNFGIEVYSVRKEKRYFGGTKFNLAHRGRARKSHNKGTPEWFFNVDLLSKPGVDEVDYELAAVVLKDAGYNGRVSYSQYDGLRVYLPREMQQEHLARLKY